MCWAVRKGGGRGAGEGGRAYSVSCTGCTVTHMRHCFHDHMHELCLQLLALCHMGDFSSSRVDVGLIDGTSCQGDQILAHAHTRKSSKCLIVVYKLQQLHPN